MIVNKKWLTLIDTEPMRDIDFIFRSAWVISLVVFFIFAIVASIKGFSVFTPAILATAAFLVWQRLKPSVNELVTLKKLSLNETYLFRNLKI